MLSTRLVSGLSAPSNRNSVRRELTWSYTLSPGKTATASERITTRTAAAVANSPLRRRCRLVIRLRPPIRTVQKNPISARVAYDGNAVQQSDLFEVVGKKIELNEQQDEDRQRDHRDPAHQILQVDRFPVATVARPGQQLHENEAVQPVTHEIGVAIRRGLFAQQRIINQQLAGQPLKLQEDVKVKKYEEERGGSEKSDQRQIDVQKRKLQRLLKEQVAMRHGADRDQQIRDQREKLSQSAPTRPAASLTAFSNAPRSSGSIFDM